ncbi:SDR family NAD(P)-dependent oxidoreductase [Pseudomonas typographi]|uniref:SDR family NAD(P)-dependent oxidoreductase n=1 Tax=Pseudomonas typographi TaxID=2715964 RepID=UPI001687320A|nr:SDR family oxidoreductase [Pseudomonas typographi]MBD1589321.1 SDR family oxidoreductase [Pseudomonas typographi]
MNRFNGKTVIVTGAGSGMGAATALRFAHEGANVVLAGRRPHKLAEVAARCDGGQTLEVPTDVSDWDAVRALVDKSVDRFGGIDVLVNNAGVAVVGSLTGTSLEEWHKVMATDVNGVVYGCRAAMPHLLARGGCIVNVSSVSGLGGDWGMSFYNAAKGAVSNFTRALALEFGGQGVRVNAVCPALTMSEMTADMAADKALMDKFADRIPMGRGAEPEEVADVIAFLASQDARFVNGVNLPVDGGLHASNGQPKQA